LPPGLVFLLDQRHLALHSTERRPGLPLLRERLVQLAAQLGVQGHELAFGARLGHLGLADQPAHTATSRDGRGQAGLEGLDGRLGVGGALLRLLELRPQRRQELLWRFGVVVVVFLGVVVVVLVAVVVLLVVVLVVAVVLVVVVVVVQGAFL
jgi:hypothetical protein